MTSYTIYKQNYFTQKKGTELVTNECSVTYLTYKLKGHQKSSQGCQTAITRYKDKNERQIGNVWKRNDVGKNGMNHSIFVSLLRQ